MNPKSEYEVVMGRIIEWSGGILFVACLLFGLVAAPVSFMGSDWAFYTVMRLMEHSLYAMLGGLPIAVVILGGLLVYSYARQR